MSDSTTIKRTKKADEAEDKPLVFGPSEAETREFAPADRTQKRSTLAQLFLKRVEAKTEAFKNTVTLSTTLFQAAFISKKLDKSWDEFGAEQAKDIGLEMMKTLIEPAAQAACEIVIGAAGGEVLLLAVPIAQTIADSAGALATVRSEVALVSKIVGQCINASRSLAAQINAQAAAQKDRVLEQHEALLEQTQQAYEFASTGDSEKSGKIQHGVEDEFLEALGAPKTGAAEAHDMAVHALHLYMAGRVNLFRGAERTDAVKEALQNDAPGDIEKVEKRLQQEESVAADRAERGRADSQPVRP